MPRVRVNIVQAPSNHSPGAVPIHSKASHSIRFGLARIRVDHWRERCITQSYPAHACFTIVGSLYSLPPPPGNGILKTSIHTSQDELKVSSGKGATPGNWQFADLVEVLERGSRSYLSKYRITFRLSSSE